MKKYVEIKSEKLQRRTVNDGQLVGTALINESMNHFFHKDVFSWNLILTLNLLEFDLNGLPLEKDLEKIQSYRRYLEEKFNSSSNPNALFLAQVCLNKSCDLIWRLHDPESVNDILNIETNQKSYGFDFGFLMTHDVDWLEVEALIEM